MIAKMDNLVRSVSFTTRQKRVGEIDGQDYVFVDKVTFEQLIVEKKMLEYETVFDNYYLTIDWQGSRYVRKVVPDSKGVFILPPEIAVLESRLRNRGQDDEAIIERRIRPWLKL